MRAGEKTSVQRTFWAKRKVIGDEVKEVGRGRNLWASVPSVVLFVIGSFKQESSM